MMKIIMLQILGMFLFNVEIGFSQVDSYHDKVSVHIELRKDTILLGEPTFFEFVLTNDSEEPIILQEGGDYRSGRKVSFDVLVISSKNDTLAVPHNFAEMLGGGGFIGYHKILPKQSRKAKLFLPMWADIEYADCYRLEVSKKFRIAPENVLFDSDDKKAELVYKKSSTSLIVVDDKKKLGEFIQKLTSYIIKETNEKVLLHHSFLTEERRLVGKIKDERMVPFLIEAYEEEKYMRKSMAIRFLVKFSKNDLAFETLKQAAQNTKDVDFYTINDSTRIEITYRQDAQLGILKRNDKEAIDFLVAKKNDEYPSERQVILGRAKLYLSDENRLKIYTAFLFDKDEEVKEKAREEINKLEKRN